jgi:hypothetical protein
MNLLRIAAFIVAFFVGAPAIAQWQTPNHSVPIGRGAGVTGFGSAAPGTAGLPLVSNGPGADPSFQAIPSGGSVAVFANIAALRANVAVGGNVYVQGYVNISDGGEGNFNYVSTDVTTADNSCTIFVDAAGHRWYRSLSGASGISFKWCGAKGDGVTNDQTAIQAAINVSCPGHLTGLVNQISPLIIPASTTPYLVTELNATNCAGFTLWGLGSGSLQPVIKYTSASNAILDMSGSVAGFNLKNFGLLGPTSDGLSATYPNLGLLIAVTAAGGGNFGEIDNVNVGGRFQKAATYIFGVCCSLGSMTSFANYNQNNTNTFSLVFTATNYFPFSTGAVTSDFVTLGSGTFGVSDWTINRGEVHTFTSGAVSSGSAILFDGTTNMNFTGGQIAACQGFLMRTNGNNSHLNFRGATFYCDNGSAPTVLLGSGTGGLMTHLTLENTYLNLGTSATVFSGQSSPEGFLFGGTINRGGTVTQYDINPLGSASGSFGSAVN